MAKRDWYFEDFDTGSSIRTATRTITEADLAAFVGLAGFFEPLFIDQRVAESSHFGRRIVPGQLTFVLSEGLLVLTGAMHHGLALLELGEFRFSLPVGVGDTIRTEVSTTSARRTSRDDRGIVGLEHRVVNHDGDVVLTYTSTRMIAARTLTGANA